MDAIRDRLWTDPEPSAPLDPATRAEILEQYKLCLELADRISQRRDSANTFLLTFHTPVIAALAGFSPEIEPTIVRAFFAVSVGFCATWWLLLRPYRTLNRAKFQVIGLLEERLPARYTRQSGWPWAKARIRANTSPSAG